MAIGNHEEIPELVRVFFFGAPVVATANCRQSRGSDRGMDWRYRNAFDYLAATDFLKKHPEKVEDVVYEYETQRRDRCTNNVSQEDDAARDTNHVTDRCKQNDDDGDGDGDHSSGNCDATWTYCPLFHSPIRWACIETEATKEAEAMEFLRTIRSINPTMFLIMDRHGDLPIDGECVLHASPELIAFLLEIYLEYEFESLNGVCMTENNFNPITCLCGTFWWEDIRKATDDIVAGRYIVAGTNVLEDNLGIEDNFWKKIILLTKAFYHKTTKDISGETVENRRRNHQGNQSSSLSKLRITNCFVDRIVEFRLLHACAGIDWFPPNLLRLLVTAFPGALLERDEDGNIPIHVAAGSSFVSYKMYDHEDYDLQGDFEANSGYQKTTIDIFLKANQHLARIKDRKGRLPLELALESQLDEWGYHDNLQSRCRPWEDGGIASLFEAYPEAAKIRNRMTGNLPLEIILSSGSCRDWDDGFEVLLRAYPEAASFKNPRTGKYPLQLAIERKTHFDDGIYGLLEASPKTVLECVSTNPCLRRPLARRTIASGHGCGRMPLINMKASRRTIPALPLFAHAASENCSTSVIYELLRMNPQMLTNSSTSITVKVHRNKRKQRWGNETRWDVASFASSWQGCDPPTKRSKRTEESMYSFGLEPKLGRILGTRIFKNADARC